MTIIEVGDIVTVTHDAYDPDDYGLNGDMYRVDELTEGGVVEARRTVDTEWLERRTYQFPIETLGLVHHHEGHACGNPIHIDHDGYVGYHRR